MNCEALAERQKIEQALVITRDALMSWIDSKSVGKNTPARRRLGLKKHDPEHVLNFLDVGKSGGITEQEARRSLGKDHCWAFKTMVRWAARIRNAWAHFDDRDIALLGGSKGCVDELARLLEEVDAKPAYVSAIKNLIAHAEVSDVVTAIDPRSRTAVRPPEPAPVPGAVSLTPDSVTSRAASIPILPASARQLPNLVQVAGSGPLRLIVNHSGQGHYRTIGEAIRASVVPGTLITVKPGTYREALVIDRDVEIVGEGDRAQVVVEATDATAVTVTADRAAVRNLTVRAVGTKEHLDAVRVQRGRVVIEGCDLTSAIGSVVSITGKDSAPVISDCEIRDGKSFGIYVHDHAQGTIEKCVISGNASAGVWISKGGNPTVRDCEIRDGKSFGISVSKKGQGTIVQCEIHGNKNAGVWISKGGNPTVRDCEIRDGQGAGVDVDDQGQGTIEKCVISGNAFAGVWISTDGNPVIRDCEIRDGQSFGIYVSEKGQGTIVQCAISGNAFAGVQIKTGGNPVIRDCEIRDGQSAGVYVFEQGQGTIEKCMISGNAGSGVQISKGGNPVVRNCKIRDGKSYGVAVADGGAGIIEGCEIEMNVKAGIHVSTEATPTVRGCKIHRGQAEGIVITQGGLGTFTRNKLTDNHGGPWGIDETSNPKRTFNSPKT